MYKDHQFSPGFFTLSGDGELDRLDRRQLADLRIERGTDGTYTHEGKPVTPPRRRSLRLLEVFQLGRAPLAGWTFRHA